jgi:C1A family cysteine protease
MNKTKYSWTPDLPDNRDYTLKIDTNAILPSIKDWRPSMPPVYDQGNLGSCTGNAIAAVAEQGLGDMPSRLFIYYNERLIEGTVKQDSGAAIRDGIKSLTKQGVCPESLWPYDISKFKRKPNKTAYKIANKFIGVDMYSRVNAGDLSSLKYALQSGPVVFGFTVYESFESQSVANTGLMPMPKNTEKSLGGHAVVCVGYDDSKNVAIVRNSWGDSWGDKGYFYMPYNYISNSNLCDDFWLVTLKK